MQYSRPQAIISADFIRKKVRLRPTVGLITGTGLGAAAQLEDPEAIFSFSDIPGFPTLMAPGQTGRISAGKIGSTELLALEGRFHLYEGHSPEAVAFPVRVMQELGIQTLILSNAAGGINPHFSPGDIMILTDHINLTGQNALVGPNEEAWGVRFPDMSQAYDRPLSRMAEKAAATLGISIQKGIYAGLLGPSLETPAETRYLRTIGADAVGFSTVHETLVAVHAGMRVLGLSLITNVHDPNHPQPLTSDQVILAGKASASTLATLIRETFAAYDLHGIL